MKLFIKIINVIILAGVIVNVIVSMTYYTQENPFNAVYFILLAIFLLKVYNMDLKA